MDPETRKVFTDADHVKSMLESDGWKIAKERFDALILDLQNIHNLDMEKPDTLGIQLASRRMAVETMMAWLKGLYGTVEQANTARDSLTDKGVDTFISRGI